MDDLSLDLIINLGVPAVLIVFAFFVGSFIERRHFRHIVKREDELREITAFAVRRVPGDLALSAPQLVCGSAVISIDYFKKFGADLRGLIGGRIGTYETLLERVRREAIIRMKDEARRLGGTIVLNVKLDSTRIYAGGKGATVSVEAVAYGTAYRARDDAAEIH